jgi:hypothetical protein
VTTVTVVWDSGTLDAGLSAVSVGFISADNPSIHWGAVDDVDHSTVEAGARMLFQQTTPPTGWTKETDANYNDAALKFVTGSVGIGGADVFSSVFGGTSVTAGHVLTVDELAIHGHTLTGLTTDSAGDHVHDHRTGVSFGADDIFDRLANELDDGFGATKQGGILSAGAHTHDISGSGDDAGADAAHAHDLTMNVKFAECCIGIKD